MLKQFKKREEGFTIIEVLIVLAIAGLIMVIVFLAVPALQRNQRNTARRSEASRVGSSASNFVTNNNGGNPTTTGDVDKIIADVGTLAQYSTLTSAAPGACSANLAMVTAKLTVCTGAGGPFTAAANVDAIVVGTGVQCQGTDTFVAGTSRQLAMVYTLEGQGSARILACQNI